MQKVCNHSTIKKTVAAVGHTYAESLQPQQHLFLIVLWLQTFCISVRLIGIQIDHFRSNKSCKCQAAKTDSPLIFLHIVISGSSEQGGTLSFFDRFWVDFVKNHWKSKAKLSFFENAFCNFQFWLLRARGDPLFFNWFFVCFVKNHWKNKAKSFFFAKWGNQNDLDHSTLQRSKYF